MLNKVNSKKRIIFLIGVVLTSIGTLLPWLDTIFMNISGIFTWGGYIVLTLLAISTSFFFLVKKEKLVSAVLIVSGILSITIVFSSNDLISDPFVGLGIGIYVTVLGSIFIVIAGIVGLLQQGDYPFEDH